VHQDAPVLVGPSLVLAMLADTAAAAPPKPDQIRVTRQDGCANPQPKADTTQIVICAPRTEGYRLNPDVIEAKREAHGAGRPHNPHEMFRDYPCQSGIGPAPCFSAGINLIAAALTAAEMAKRLAEGKEIGSMFITDPHPDEYHLYLAAKARRQAREKEQAAAKAAKAAKVEAAAPAATEPAAK
jgi:hypothetical protein